MFYTGRWDIFEMTLGKGCFKNSKNSYSFKSGGWFEKMQMVFAKKNGPPFILLQTFIFWTVYKKKYSEEKEYVHSSAKFLFMLNCFFKKSSLTK